MFSYIKGLKLS